MYIYNLTINIYCHNIQWMSISPVLFFKQIYKRKISEKRKRHERGRGKKSMKRQKFAKMAQIFRKPDRIA